MRRRKLLAVLAGLAVLAAGAWPRSDRITRQNVDSIKDGMSQAEVEAILGPPGDYTTGPVRWMRWMSVDEAVAISGSAYDSETPETSWMADTGMISVRFGSHGVYIKRFADAQKEEQTLPDNLLWRAKRLWRKWFPA
jgi:hypothetical protein